MEFDILLHEHQPFDCVLQFGNVRCDVTSENSRQMYESTPFCLVNNKVLDLGKYCEFDRKLIGYVSFIHSSAICTKIVLPLHFYFNIRASIFKTERAIEMVLPCSALCKQFFNSTGFFLHRRLPCGVTWPPPSSLSRSAPRGAFTAARLRTPTQVAYWATMNGRSRTQGSTPTKTSPRRETKHVRRDKPALVSQNGNPFP